MSADELPEDFRAALERHEAVLGDLHAKPEIQRALAVLLSARRLYLLGYMELHALLGDAPSVSEEVVVRAIAEAAAEPFDIGRLVRDLRGAVSAILAKYAEAAAHRAAHEPKPDVPLGFTIAAGRRAVDRNRPVVVEAAAADFAALATEVIVPEVVGAGGCVLHLTINKVSPDDLSVDYVPVPRHLWERCCDTSAGPKRLVELYAADKLTRAPDLILCDDLTLAASPGYVGQPPAAVASTANRRLGALARATGSALVSGAAPAVLDNELAEPIKLASLIVPASMVPPRV